MAHASRKSRRAKTVARKAKAKPKRVGRRVVKRVQRIPSGYHTVTAYLVQDDCAKALEFYKGAFGARERMRMAGPDAKIAHAEIKIGSSIVMMSDEMRPMPGQPGTYKSPRAAGLSTCGLFLYVNDVDASFDRAVRAGCIVRQPLTDMFWGDRYGQVIDPFGHTWGMATHKEDVSPAEMARRQREMFAKMGGGGQPSV